MKQVQEEQVAFELEQLECQRKEIAEEQGQLDRERKEIAADANRRIKGGGETERENKRSGKRTCRMQGED